jgi:hypothetical protein
MDIDDLLTQSSPLSADRTPEFREALRLLAADAESQSRAPRRPRRVALLIATSAAIVGLGAAGATAAGFIPGWVPWATSEGTNCSMQFRPRPVFTEEELLEYPNLVGDEYPALLLSEEEYPHLSEGKVRAVKEALTFLARFNLDSIDEARVVRDYQQVEDAVIASLPSVEENPRIEGEEQPRLTGADLAVAAVAAEVSKALEEHLVSVGLPSDAVGVHQLSVCE